MFKEARQRGARQTKEEFIKHVTLVTKSGAAWKLGRYAHRYRYPRSPPEADFPMKVRFSAAEDNSEANELLDAEPGNQATVQMRERVKEENACPVCMSPFSDKVVTRDEWQIPLNGILCSRGHVICLICARKLAFESVCSPGIVWDCPLCRSRCGVELGQAVAVIKGSWYHCDDDGSWRSNHHPIDRGCSC